jgi:hypothetical protein
MAAHASQIDPDLLPGGDGSVTNDGADNDGGISGDGGVTGVSGDFAEAYGYEWFCRDGAPGVLDALGNVHLLAGAR